MKRIIAIMLSLTIIISSNLPVFASSNKTLKSMTLEYQEKPIKIDYLIENNQITYAEIDDNIVEYIGNEVYFNGELLATVNKTIVDNNSSFAEPRVSWTYTKNCPYGSPNDYTVYLREVEYDIQLRKTILELTFSEFLGIMMNLIPFQLPSYAEEVLDEVFEAIAEKAVEDLFYGMTQYLYAEESIYSHPVVGSAYHKNYFLFYNSERSNSNGNLRGTSGKRPDSTGNRRRTYQRFD